MTYSDAKIGGQHARATRGPGQDRYGTSTVRLRMARER
jgi:hypothetical protein